jgi:hypothetical protein
VNPQDYLDLNYLWDLNKLKQHSQEHFVYVIESPRFPNLVMLHYQDACQYDNLWDDFNKCCRGLILDLQNRKVIAWPLNKFWNLGERSENKYEELIKQGAFETTEKLDGSMCIMFKDPNTNKYCVTTKGSFDSEHGLYAMSFLPTMVNDLPSLNNLTLMFELISKKFQIVIDYQKKNYKEGLYLIGARNLQTGKLLSTWALKELAELLQVPTFKTYSFNSLDSLLEHVKILPVLEEGFVLRYPGDLLVKVKGPAYLEAHRFVSHLSDRNILEAVGNSTVNTLVALAPEEYRQDVLNKIDLFEKRVENIKNICYTYYEKAPKDLRKNFAMWVNQFVEKDFRSFLFQLFDHKILDKKAICKVIAEIDNVSGRTSI